MLNIKFIQPCTLIDIVSLDFVHGGWDTFTLSLTDDKD